MKSAQPLYTVGLDCGCFEVKFAVCEHLDSRCRVTCLASVETDSGSVKPEGEGIEKSVARALQKVVTQHSLAGLPTAIGIPVSQVVMKWVGLPPMSDEDLQMAARTKVRKDLPFPPEQAYISASSGARSDSGETLVTAVSKSDLKSLAATVSSVGLNPIHAEAEAQSVVRLLQRTIRLKKQHTSTASFTLVDLGYAATRMYVVQEGQLRFARSIKFGALHFVNRMVEGLDVAPAQASAMLSDPDCWLSSGGKLHVPYGGQHAIVSVDQEVLLLSREFHRLIRYFRSIFPSRSFSGMLDSFLLCGGLSGLNGLAEFIGNEVQMKMTQFDPFATVALDLDAAGFAQVKHSPGRFTTAMGLALCGVASLDSPKEAVNEFSWARLH